MRVNRTIDLEGFLADHRFITAGMGNWDCGRSVRGHVRALGSKGDSEFKSTALFSTTLEKHLHFLYRYQQTSSPPSSAATSPATAAAAAAAAEISLGSCGALPISYPARLYPT